MSETDIIREINIASADLNREIPGAVCTYFRTPGYFQVWLNNKPVCGYELEFSTYVSAVNHAITEYTKEKSS